MPENDSLQSLFWVKKHQLSLVFSSGRLELTEYKFEYLTSATWCNKGKDMAYVAVVDGAAINLTPMGKFVMPPPMFEKQVKLPFVPKAVCLYGHFGVAYID